MTAVTAPADYRVTIGGNVSGQVAVGNNIVQIGRVEGGVVYVTRPGETAAPRARPTPIFQRPRRFRGFLDRRQEASTAATALQSNLPVEFYGQSGIGKTALLRHLAYHLPADRFSDGVVYVRVQGKTLDDILQNLFDAFYESEIPLKATMTQLRHALGDKKALILLDDVAVTRDDLEALLDVAPNCVFLVAAEDRRLYGEGRAVALNGLPPEEALALLERELGRPLSEAERSGAQGLAAQLEGHPLQILRMASLVRDGDVSLTELDGYRLAGAGQVTAQRVEALPERERRVVLGLAAVGGLPVSELHVAALAGLPDASVALQALAERGLVQIQDQQVRLPGDVAAALQQEADLAVHRTWALATFTQLAETQAEALAADSSAIQHLLTWAVESGRWSEALRLVRAVEGAVALDRQWGAWKQLLQSGLRAAQSTGNRSAEAWAWHQLGTRALCLEETEAARTALVQALRLREKLGEKTAAAITRHNLKVLLGPPLPLPDPPPPPPFPTVAALIAIVAAVLATLLAASAFVPMPSVGGPTTTITPTTMPAMIATTQTATATTTATATATATTTPTATPTTSPTPSATPCRPTPPFGWVTYVVQRGDTLFSLATATGTTVDRIRQVNCLEGTLFAGTSIWLPVRPATPTPTPSPTATDSPTPGLPDLVAAIALAGDITVFPGAEQVGARAAQSGAQFEVPLRIVVTNVGGMPTESFIVAVAGEANGPTYDVYRSVFRAGPLAAGDNVEFSDVALVSVELERQTITLVVKADSCDGEVVVNASACRVQESNEDNNVATLHVTLPPAPVPPTPPEKPTAIITEAPNKSPQVSISQPENGSVYSYEGQGDYWYVTIPLLATAFDSEDGPLGGDALSWTASYGTIRVDDTSTGSAWLHVQTGSPCDTRPVTITVTATDSAGKTGSDSNVITLGNSQGCDEPVEPTPIVEETSE